MTEVESGPVLPSALTAPVPPLGVLGSGPCRFYITGSHGVECAFPHFGVSCGCHLEEEELSCLMSDFLQVLLFVGEDWGPRKSGGLENPR